MGIYDRDYYRNDPRSSFGSFQIQSVTVWLIVINVAVFIIDGFLKRTGQPSPVAYDPEFGRFVRAVAERGPIEEWGYFSVGKAIYHLQLWRFVTFQFLHASPTHLLGNMLGLYFFGPIVESYLVRRRFIVFYLLCGIAGAGLYVILWAVQVLILDARVPMVGASAGVFGILIAAGTVAPGMTITLWFPPITLELRIFAWIMVAIAAFTVFNSGGNVGGEAAHLGGALAGYGMIRNPGLLNWVVPSKRVRAKRRVQKDWSKDLNR